MLPPTQRLPELRALIDRRNYFVLHAPRQVGKTTALLSLGRSLTSEGRYAAVLLSVETGAPFKDDAGAAELAVLGNWRWAAQGLLPADLQPPPWPEANPGSRIRAALSAWARASPRPLVLFLDEIDALAEEALSSFLRQLRDGTATRPSAFPWSLALIGMRDVRDYKIASGGDDLLGTSSPFNIKTDSLTLRNFTAAEVAELCLQHTAETGQPFEPGTLDRVFELTRGQPWLVNAIARQLVDDLVPDRRQMIATAHVDQAKDALIRRQDTHLDSLAERLEEPRVRHIIEPMLAGVTLDRIPDDDLRFVQDLGLVEPAPEGGLRIANPIYQEVIPRVLSRTASASLPQIAPSWLDSAGRLHPPALLQAFLTFWRQHGAPLFRTAPYPEIALHLVLIAFLHRVANGGGTVEREYAIGRGRMDLCLRYGPDVLAIEVKVWRRGRADPLAEGLEQVDGYLDGLGLDRGWLIIFDQRPDLPPLADRIETATVLTPGHREVILIRS